MVYYTANHKNSAYILQKSFYSELKIWKLFTKVESEFLINLVILVSGVKRCQRFKLNQPFLTGNGKP